MLSDEAVTLPKPMVKAILDDSHLHFQLYFMSYDYKVYVTCETDSINMGSAWHVSSEINQWQNDAALKKLILNTICSVMSYLWHHNGLLRNLATSEQCIIT